MPISLNDPAVHDVLNATPSTTTTVVKRESGGLKTSRFSRPSRGRGGKIRTCDPLLPKSGLAISSKSVLPCQVSKALPHRYS